MPASRLRRTEFARRPPQPCTVGGCGRPRHARRMCRGHYGEALRAEQHAAQLQQPRRTRPGGGRHRIPAKVRAVVVARAAGECEACGGPLPARPHLHHRRSLAQGGLDVPANLVVLHPACHVDAPLTGRERITQAWRPGALPVHKNPAAAGAIGLILASTAVPAAEPLTLPPAEPGQPGRPVLLHPTEPRYLDVGLPAAA